MYTDHMAYVCRDFQLHRLRRDDAAMQKRMSEWKQLVVKAEVTADILNKHLWRAVPEHEQEFLRAILKQFKLCAEAAVS